MEPITLCGLVIVFIGAAVELEGIFKGITRILGACRPFRALAALSTAMQKPACGNRYVPYPG